MATVHCHIHLWEAYEYFNISVGTFVVYMFVNYILCMAAIYMYSVNCYKVELCGL